MGKKKNVIYSEEISEALSPSMTRSHSWVPGPQYSLADLLFLDNAEPQFFH